METGKIKNKQKQNKTRKSANQENKFTKIKVGIVEVDKRMSLNEQKEKNIVNELDYEESTSEEEDVEVKKGKKEE